MEQPEKQEPRRVDWLTFDNPFIDAATWRQLQQFEFYSDRPDGIINIVREKRPVKP